MDQSLDSKQLIKQLIEEAKKVAIQHREFGWQLGYSEGLLKALEGLYGSSVADIAREVRRTWADAKEAEEGLRGVWHSLEIKMEEKLR